MISGEEPRNNKNIDRHGGGAFYITIIIATILAFLVATNQPSDRAELERILADALRGNKVSLEQLDAMTIKHGGEVGNDQVVFPRDFEAQVEMTRGIVDELITLGFPPEVSEAILQQTADVTLTTRYSFRDTEPTLDGIEVADWTASLLIVVGGNTFSMNVNYQFEHLA